MDSKFMAEALSLARGRRTHPNPTVGAVVVDASGVVVGRGFHEGPGTPHAEVIALGEAGGRARGSTVYVTLEPCSHRGRTEPCVDALIEAGASRVIAAVGDPDDRVAGMGFERLRQAGVETAEGVAVEEAEALDPAYFHHRRTGLPLVTIKAALTLDGSVAALDGSSQWITSPEARADGHHLRSQADAVMVGAGTVLSDDPALSVRLAGHDGYQPTPVVVAGRRLLPFEAKVFERSAFVLAPGQLELPATVLDVGGDGRVDLAKGLAALADLGLLDVLVEGGSLLFQSLLAEGLVQRAFFYYGARLAGGAGRPVFDAVWETLTDTRSVEIVDSRKVGPDLRVELRI